MPEQATDAIDAAWLAFMASRRTATLATLSDSGQPRLVPICFVVAERHRSSVPIAVWSPLDTKPKRDADVRRLARVRDIQSRPEVTLLFERWSEDWSELAWLRADGRAELVDPADDAEAHRRAVEALSAKYPQYRSQPIDVRPMIRVVLIRATMWSASPLS
jgi:PPOX class probable F420-dependent enzyme